MRETCPHIFERQTRVVRNMLARTFTVHEKLTSVALIPAHGASAVALDEILPAGKLVRVQRILGHRGFLEAGVALLVVATLLVLQFLVDETLVALQACAELVRLE